MRFRYAVWGLANSREFPSVTGLRDRIVACINALVGVEDPEKFVATAKAALARLDAPPFPEIAGSGRQSPAGAVPASSSPDV
jgi:hypothetical protein